MPEGTCLYMCGGGCWDWGFLLQDGTVRRAERAKLPWKIKLFFPLTPTQIKLL